ncbi:hypothetical protein [Spectribacter hydrogenoxidans]|uniref:Transposase n=1 Tax=Spectribacter hydrogenoxidans TaxID=3075608 RepID=A0ABU3C2W9_9GAMM|nr:hypothetical protein [Salinisphaera sp. W335]MDT0635908.1 hypothetical protein [Salinisphaera sp. W335]
MLTIPHVALGELEKWAPPVVLPGANASKALVIGNVLTAVLFRHIDPSRQIKVRRLKRNTSLRRSLDEICVLTLAALDPLYRRTRQLLPGIANSLEEAQLLSGYSRARCAQLRRVS